MNFELNEDQTALRDSVTRLLGDSYGFEQRRAIVAGPAGHSPQVWRHLAELGVTGLPIASVHGGYDGGAADMQPLLHALGKVLSTEPLIGSCVVSATAVRHAGTDVQHAATLPDVASGATVLAWADDEDAGRHAAVWTDTAARCNAGIWTLHGQKVNVVHAPNAHAFVVSARLSGQPSDVDGRALFLVRSDAAGLHSRGFRFFDDSPAGELRLDGAVAEALGDPTDGTQAAAAIAAARAAGIAALCADTVGAMEAAYELSCSYLNTRKQFGRLIGENQALRHKAAEMLVSLEVCRSMALAAAAAVDQPDEVCSALDLLRAKLLIGRHSHKLCQTAIQLHGGIGMTEEYAVGHYLRRVALNDQLFGDSDAQTGRLAALLASRTSAAA